MRLFLLYEGVFSRKYVRGRLQVRARTVASTCGDGCKYVRPRRAKLALETFSCMSSDGLKKTIITCNEKRRADAE